MTAGVVSDNGVVDAVFAKLPGRQTGSLVERPGFIHPDVNIDAFVKGGIDRGGGRAVLDTGQPAGVAVGQDMDGLSFFLALSKTRIEK